MGPAIAQAAATVPVVRCPTTFGSDARHPPAPQRIAVLHRPASVRGLVAYSNTDLFLIAPAGLNCSGSVGVDGSSGIAVWPRGGNLTASRDRVVLEVEAACTTCQAALACPFFVAFAGLLQSPCPADVPTGERVDRFRPDEVLFEDPPGVRGTGAASGGRDAANGVVVLSDRYGVMRETCTLPARRRGACTVGLNDAIVRYG